MTRKHMERATTLMKTRQSIPSKDRASLKEQRKRLKL
ncbi:hypothetical protein Ccrd_023841 [Cynara cardunculus var. scolymus]|uniref:Uncharacterized protein n=1 Tax=Cynara cardunculus var. scolymus TaxID=59895 RepID=A0A103XW02_CYNCS|nr:hypothetical protein Ccrd_023841 [Cynara cardunculus var. scolymus]